MRCRRLLQMNDASCSSKRHSGPLSRVSASSAAWLTKHCTFPVKRAYTTCRGRFVLQLLVSRQIPFRVSVSPGATGNFTVICSVRGSVVWTQALFSPQRCSPHCRGWRSSHGGSQRASPTLPASSRGTLAEAKGVGISKQDHPWGRLP